MQSRDVNRHSTEIIHTTTNCFISERSIISVITTCFCHDSCLLQCQVPGQFNSQHTDSNTSQGSVATCSRWGEIFNNYFIANLLQNVSVKVNISFRYRQQCTLWLSFLSHSIHPLIASFLKCSLLKIMEKGWGDKVMVRTKGDFSGAPCVSVSTTICQVCQCSRADHSTYL